MMPNEIILYLFGTAVLIAAAVSDLRSRRIPNRLTYPAMAAAVLYHTAVQGWPGFLFGAGGVGVGMGVFLIFFLLGGMGAGDVKLMGVVGGLLGPKGALLAALCTALAGGIYAVGLLSVHGTLRETARRCATMLQIFMVTRNFIYLPPARKEKKPRLIYGLAIAAGTFIAMGVGRNVW